MVIARRPGNRIVWLCCGIGLGQILAGFGSQTAASALAAGPDRGRAGWSCTSWVSCRLINRTLVYGLLTGLLGLGYVAGSLLFVLVAGVGADPPSWLVAAATLAAAAVFRPARRRIQQLVDRQHGAPLSRTRRVPSL